MRIKELIIKMKYLWFHIFQQVLLGNYRKQYREFVSRHWGLSDEL